MKIILANTISRVMLSKISFVLTFVIFCSSSLFANDAKSQSTSLSIEARNESIAEVIQMIENRSGYLFVYDKNEINLNKKVSVEVIDGTIDEVLAEVFNSNDVKYQKVGTDIVLTKAKTQSPSTRANTQSDTRSIRGKVTDSKGESIPGATIAVKGTTTGTVTNLDGEFSLKVPNDAVLIVSFVGLKTQEVEVGNRTSLNVSLQPENSALDEVVVVGYGTTKKANLTGAVATISSETLSNRTVPTAAAAIQGVDPSVNLGLASGVPDAGYSVNIRGISSLNGGAPLVIADGVEVSLSQINPNDIESVSILKDASSAAIYGAKASSGVILITTKQGSNTGGSAISYSGRMSWSNNTTSTDFVRTGYEHTGIANKFYNVTIGYDILQYSDEEMQMLYDRRHDMNEHPDRPWVMLGDNGEYKYYGNFDWYNYFFRKTRPEQEHNVTATGGNKNINYYISGRYLGKEGMFKIREDEYENLSFKTKLNIKLKPWLKYTGDVNFNNVDYSYGGPPNEERTFRVLQSNVFSTWVPRNPDGSIVQYTNQLAANSPIASGVGGYLTANQAHNNRNSKNLILSNQLKLDFTKNFNLTAQYAYKNTNALNTYRGMPFEFSRRLGVYETFTSGTVADFYRESSSVVKNHNTNVYLTYSNNWNKNHNFKAVAGVQYERYRRTYLSTMQNDLLADDLNSFAVATGEITLSQTIAEFRTMGYFGRINYDYKGKYLFEASGRFDQTSRFAEGDRLGFFPSASAGWRISEEDFFAPEKDVLSNVKLRGSVGSLGNQQVGTYAYFDRISTDNQMNYTFEGDAKAEYASVSAPISSSLTWETITTYDIGIDLGFFDNRLNFTGDYFIRDTKGMLTPSLTPPSVYGASTPEENNADMRTKGWELYLSWNDKVQLAGKNLNYNVKFTLGDYQSTVTKYNNPNKLISDYYEGRKVGEIWGYSVDGLFESDEEAAKYQATYNDQAVNYRVYISPKEGYLRAGDVRFKDTNGDYVINEGAGTVEDPGDRKIIGNSTPRYNYSMSLGANWNGFDVSVFFQGVGKRDWYPTQYAYDFWGPYSQPFVSFIGQGFMDNVWSETNTGAYFPRARGYSSYSSGALYVRNDRYLQDVSYLRLKNVTIGYTLPVKRYFDRVRIYVSGENLFYWSKLKKYTKTLDPELAASSGVYDSGSGTGYPYSRMFSVGVDITF